ncbi:Ig-like domain-containing protein [Methanosphaera sp. ISO3-F5]|uniref:Ig-like domain-containing protein n=1 Tax=Methanosphaera sp. ISO3-F5 TaxID=1452353 RepID=UPI002B261E0A|nr:Ig-like domain-containing protein [Methanosphaera sp. ISO3-F5]WQH63681.1 Ig-like domain-containing protein [Methanosphaera sp. ISO3-F5]
MKKKQTIKKLLLLLILTVLLIGIASATEHNNQTNTNKNTIEKSLQNTQTDTKEINKQDTTTNTKTSTTKTPTKITLNKIKTTEFSDKIMITGTYKTSKGTPLKNTAITLNINGKQYKTKTYSSGKYFYKYQTNKVGTNTITATYPGNNKYKAATTKTTFKVTKKGTRIKINYIPTTEYTDKVIIKGKFTNNKAKALMSATIILKINGKKYSTKTDKNGEFTYNYKTNKIGTNNITAYFRGNDYYKYNSTKKTFKVNKITTYTSLYQPYYNKTNKMLLLSGLVYDEQDTDLKKVPVTLNINGKYYKTTTGEYGGFDFQTKLTKSGSKKITITYHGNNKYAQSSVKTTISIPIVKATRTVTVHENTKKNTIITSTTIFGDKIEIRYDFGPDPNIERIGTRTNSYMRNKKTGEIYKRHLDYDGVYRYYKV